MTRLEKGAAWAAIGAAVIALLTFLDLQAQGGESEEQVPPVAEPQVAAPVASDPQPPSTPSPTVETVVGGPSPPPTASWIGFDIENVTENSDWATASGGQVFDYPWAWDPQPAGTLGGQVFERALIVAGTHENAWPLQTRYGQFTATLGVDDVAEPGTVLRFVTRCDDVVLSDVRVEQGGPEQIALPVAGCFRLSMSVVSEAPDDYQPGFVGDPRVTAG